MHHWEVVIKVLSETQQWCQGRVDLNAPAQCLRSPELRPHAYPDEWYYTQLYPQRIADLIRQRQGLLEMSSPSTELSGGRILCMLHYGDTAMGEGEPASQGFIDDAYFPPWDTWFAYLADVQSGGVLLAWIPAEFELLVEDAIAVAATEPICWLDAVGWELPNWWSPVIPILQQAAQALPQNNDNP
ncbi:hypothetical protein ACFFLM_08950 [Deinococcus oregonensis]|uniref:Uncharacterized protein n=1 Tax=Deinococcus oregonensis TaxID=1805970 RepID=A0ABV6AX52_9DEIO